MEHVSNEEKAKKIAESCSVMPLTPITQADVIAMTNNAAMQAMEWKDKEHAKEKQQWIEKAVIFLNERVCTGMSIPEIHNMIVDFRKSMEE